MKNLKEIVEKYKNNPIEFVEDFCGVKLNVPQKIMLKTLNKNKDKKFLFISGRRSYLSICEDALNLSLEDLNNILNKEDS